MSGYFSAQSDTVEVLYIKGKTEPPPLNMYNESTTVSCITAHALVLALALTPCISITSHGAWHVASPGAWQVASSRAWHVTFPGAWHVTLLELGTWHFLAAYVEILKRELCPDGKKTANHRMPWPYTTSWRNS